MRPVCLGLRLGLYLLSPGLLGVLTLGLLNRILIQDIEIPAAVAALVIGVQELMGFVRARFGHWSDRRPANSQRRTPFVLASSFSIACLFAAAVWVVLQLADAMQSGLAGAVTGWIV